MNVKFKRLIGALSVLIGMVVGAGFLGIPKALTFSGFVPGVIMMLVVAFVMFFMFLFTTELTLNTKKVYQMPGMIGKYLGKNFGKIAGVVFGFISFGAMTAYLIGSSEIMSSYLPFSQTICMIIYFLAISFIVLKGLSFVEKAEIYIAIALLIFLAILGFFMKNDFEWSNLALSNINDLIVPLGVILFSFGGYNAMSHVELITKSDKKLMVKASIFGVVIPFIFFVTFAILLLGVYGNNVESVATQSLSGTLGLIGNIIAFLAMTSSYIMSGLLLKDMLIDDYGFNKTISGLLTMSLPFIFTIIVNPDFMNVLSFTGSVLSGLFALILCATIIVHRKKIKKVYFKTPGGNFTPIFVGVFFLIAMLLLIFKNFI